MPGSANHSAGKEKPRTKKTLECKLPDTFYHNTPIFIAVQHSSTLSVYRCIQNHVIHGAYYWNFSFHVNHFYDVLQSTDFTYFIVSLNLCTLSFGHIHSLRFFWDSPRSLLSQLCVLYFFSPIKANFSCLYYIHGHVVFHWNIALWRKLWRFFFVSCWIL